MRVYEYTRAAGRRRGWIESCVLGTGKRTSLNAEGYYEVPPPPAMALNGYALAYVIIEFDDVNGGETASLAVEDARSTSPLGAAAKPGAGEVVRVVIRRNQAVAWTSATRSHAVVHSWPSTRDRPRVIAQGRRLDPRSLRLSGSRLSWRQGGRVRHATLR